MYGFVKKWNISPLLNSSVALRVASALLTARTLYLHSHVYLKLRSFYINYVNKIKIAFETRDSQLYADTIHASVHAKMT